MLRKARFMLLLLVFILVPSIVVSQNQQEKLQEQIYVSFVTGDIPLWESTISQLEVLYKSRPFSSVLYDLLLARYGFIAFSMDDNPAKARQHLDKAESELEKLFTYPTQVSNAYALQGAFLGFRISLRPISAVILGPRSYRAINSAVEADPENPTAWMEMANSRFYTPSTFGGSKEEALEYYQKAIQLFEKDLQPHQKWLYLNCLVGLAKSYQFTNRKNLAIATYRKSLTFEPGFKWVRDDLLQEILK